MPYIPPMTSGSGVGGKLNAAAFEATYGKPGDEGPGPVKASGGARKLEAELNEN